MEFDGSSTENKGGTNVILRKNGGKIQLSFKLDFKCSDNEAKYEVLALGLFEALRRGIHVIRIKGDSNLVVKQVTGDFALKHT